MKFDLALKCRLRTLLPLLVLLCNLPAWAQPEFESWGKVSEEDKALKVCAYDSEAVAIVLLHEAVADHNDERHLIINHHIRIKILKEKGLEYANIEIPYAIRNDFQNIEDIEAIAYNFSDDGTLSMQTVDRKSIYNQPLNQYWHAKRFAFPGVKAGSIVEYKYRSVEKSIQALDEWQFQKDLPVAQSTFNLSIPPNTEFAYMVYKSDQLPITVKPDSREGKIFFEMKNIPGLRHEPYMDARKDYLQRVTFQLSGYNNGGFGKQKYMTSWEEVIKELNTDPYFGTQVGKNISGTEDLVSFLKLVPSPEEKMRKIYYYTRNNMSWNGFVSRNSGDGVKAAWSKKKGNITEVNFVLLNLLLEAGLEAYPVLVSERQHGKVNTQYPFLDQFSSTYVVVMIGDRKYFLDATDPVGQPDMVPFDVLNTTGLIVNRKKGGLVKIADESVQFKENITISLKLGANQQLEGTAFINSAQYARLERLRDWQRGRERYLDGFRKTGSSIKVDSIGLKNEKVDSLPLSQQITFTTPVTSTGDYLFVPINMLSGFESNPFISNNRFSDVNFGYRQHINFSTYIDIPEGYAIDALPKSLQLINSDKTVVFVRELFNDANSNKVLARVRIEMKKSLYTVDEYGELKEFYKKMFDLLNEQIVFKKK